MEIGSFAAGLTQALCTTHIVVSTFDFCLVPVGRTATVELKFWNRHWRFIVQYSLRFP